jgi:hypothetical protein
LRHFENELNYLFLSPFFPPNAHYFCSALRARGVRVLAVGDEPPERQPSELRGVLAEYVYEPAMASYPMLREAVAGLISRHGPLSGLDSNGEHWLEVEGRLRDDFRVPGLSLAEVCAHRSKSRMGAVFRGAGIAYPDTVPSQPAAGVRELARSHGFPLVFKPDSGSGSVDTFVVGGEAELDAALARELPDHVVQPFVAGEIATFDGLTNGAGEIVFQTSHAYDRGIMQVRTGELDGSYYSLRSIPTALEQVGRRAVAAFEIKARFFHLELFHRADGSYVGLEMNIRPPGGFTTDMMCAAAGIDIYDWWAAVVTGASAQYDYELPYHTAHAGRRTGRPYHLSHEQLSAALGDRLFSVQRIPDAFAATMGNVAYLVKSPDLAQVRADVDAIQGLVP